MSNKFIGIPDLESKTANEIIQFQEILLIIDKLVKTVEAVQLEA